MAGGELSVIAHSLKLRLMWLVDSWALLQPLTMELLARWGKYIAKTSMVRIIIIMKSVILSEGV